jgi:hypothetical protein
VRTWGEFAAAEPELAAFGARLLLKPPAYLATVRANGEPRVHPVTPILTDDGLYVFMEPSSPKGRDLRERGWFALHNGVPDTEGTGGEFTVRGRGVPTADAALWSAVADAASYDPADGYVLFELKLTEARCRGYGDVDLPARRKWVEKRG